MAAIVAAVLMGAIATLIAVRPNGPSHPSTVVVRAKNTTIANGDHIGDARCADHPIGDLTGLNSFNRPATYPEQRTALADELRAAGLSDYIDAYLSLTKPAALLVPTRMSDDEIPVGCTKIGGWPDLPPAIDLPRSDLIAWTHQGNDDPRPVKTGETLTIKFLLQINLAELAGIDLGMPLPDHGLLSVFHNADTQEEFGFQMSGARPGWRVLYFDDTDTLVRKKSPPETVSIGPDNTPTNPMRVDGTPFLSYRLSPRQITTLPDLIDVVFPVIETGATKLAEPVVDKMIAFNDREFINKAVRIGGYAYSAGGGEPLDFASEPYKSNDTERQTHEAHWWRTSGWRPLLSVFNGEMADFPNGVPIDFTFGGDGQMAVYVKVGDSDDWLNPSMLETAIAPISR